MYDVAVVQTLQTCSNSLNNPLDLMLQQRLIRLLGDIPKQVTTRHKWSHTIVGVIVLKALEHLQHVSTARLCHFLKDGQLLKLLLILFKYGVNGVFSDSFDGYLNT